MKSVHYHPDGKIYIRSETVTYEDTMENFTADFGYMLPPLPEGITERIYDQGRRHALMWEENGEAHVTGGPLPWSEGDHAIDDLGKGLAIQKNRKAMEEAARVKELIRTKGGFNAN